MPTAAVNRTAERDVGPDRRACAPAPKRDGLSYPYARLDDGQLVHVDQYDGVTAVRCLGCDGAMHARGGDLRRVRRHFAHHALIEGTCSHESALHAAAKAAICEGFAAAKAAGRPYKLSWICDGCESNRDADLVRICERATLETEMVPGVVSDLAFEGPRRFAVEVVVTHPPEAQTLSRYEAAGVPLFLIRPTWATITTLAEGVHADQPHFINAERCKECQRRRSVREATERARDGFLAQLRTALAQLPPSLIPIQHWTTDRRGNPMYPRVAAKLYATATKLCANGLKQIESKPWLFILPIKGIGTFFADLGGTEEIPIWEDPTPLYYCKLNGQAEPHEEAIALLIIDHLVARGIPLRTSFYSRY